MTKDERKELIEIYYNIFKNNDFSIDVNNYRHEKNYTFYFRYKTISATLETDDKEVRINDNENKIVIEEKEKVYDRFFLLILKSDFINDEKEIYVPSEKDIIRLKHHEIIDDFIKNYNESWKGKYTYIREERYFGFNFEDIAFLFDLEWKNVKVLKHFNCCVFYYIIELSPEQKKKLMKLEFGKFVTNSFKPIIEKLKKDYFSS